MERKRGGEGQIDRERKRKDRAIERERLRESVCVIRGPDGQFIPI